MTAPLDGAREALAAAIHDALCQCRGNPLGIHIRERDVQHAMPRIVAALSAAGYQLVPRTGGESWTQYGVRLPSPSSLLARGIVDGHLIVGDDFTGCPDELAQHAQYRATAEHGVAEKRVMQPGPWVPVSGEGE